MYISRLRNAMPCAAAASRERPTRIIRGHIHIMYVFPIYASLKGLRSILCMAIDCVPKGKAPQFCAEGSSSRRSGDNAEETTPKKRVRTVTRFGTSIKEQTQHDLNSYEEKMTESTEVMEADRETVEGTRKIRHKEG